MSQLLDMLAKHLDGGSVDQLSRSIEAPADQTRDAIGAILPTLITGLARNAESGPGREQLHQALRNDHDGSVLDHLGSLFGGSAGTPPPEVPQRSVQGGSILDHILGGRRERVAAGVSKSSGLSSGQTMRLMMLLAPVVMAALGRMRKSQELSEDQLGTTLADERHQVQSDGGGLLAKFFDQDGDGDFDMMDIMRFGAGRLFGRG